jgi:hypothetical protein
VVARQHTLLRVAKALQHQSDNHLLVEYDPRITEYPVHSYMLFTPPVGRGNKLLPKHRGLFQVMDNTDSIYTIEDLVSGKRITTHMHNLRPFIYDPIRTNPLTVAQHNEQEFITATAIQRQVVRIRRFQRQLGTTQGLMHVDKLIPQENLSQVATENLSQDIPGLFPALSWLVFPLGFK